MTKLIITINTIIVLLLAVAAFILSYHSLRDILEIYPGVDDAWRWLWPLLLDVGLISFALVIVGYRLHGEKTGCAWLLLIVYTLGTVVFNIASIGQWSIVGAIIAASKPLTLFFAFHLLMQMLERFALRREAANTLAELTQQITAKNDQATTLQTQLDDLQTKIQAKKNELKDVQSDLTNAKWLSVNESVLSDARAILSERSGLNGSELGRALGKSASFGRRLKRVIDEEAQPELISTNGRHGHLREP